MGPIPGPIPIQSPRRYSIGEPGCEIGVVHLRLPPPSRRLLRNPFPDLNPFQSLQATPTHSFVEDRTAG